jgi:hypothetical protein
VFREHGALPCFLISSSQIGPSRNGGITEHEGG